MFLLTFISYWRQVSLRLKYVSCVMSVKMDSLSRTNNFLEIQRVSNPSLENQRISNHSNGWKSPSTLVRSYSYKSNKREYTNICWADGKMNKLCQWGWWTEGKIRPSPHPSVHTTQRPGRITEKWRRVKFMIHFVDWNFCECIFT